MPACGDGNVDGREVCDDANVDDLDGCDAECRVSITALWRIPLPPMYTCPRLAALDDGGVAIVGNDMSVSTPQILVVDADGTVRWTEQSAHLEHDSVADVVAEPSGFVVTGHASGRRGALGWMQRWSGDGALVAETILGIDEIGHETLAIERRDAASYWIVAKDDFRSPHALHFRGFDQPPTSSTTIGVDLFDVLLARGPEAGAYVAADGDFGTLTRFDVGGEVLWTTEYAAPREVAAFPYALASTAGGDAIVAGTDQGEPDAQWIRRFDPDGNELWRVPVEVSAMPSGDQPLHIVVDDTDSVFVTGWSVMEDGNDAFVAKYDGDGAALWQASWGEDSEVNARPCDIVLTTGGEIVVAGNDFLAGDQVGMSWLRAFAP